MTKILDGKILAEEKLAELKKKIAASPKKPGLAVVLVGDDPASHLYINLKEEACREAGMHFEKHLFNKDTDQEEIIKKIRVLNKKENIHGIIVQLPLPQHLDEAKIIKEISPAKDADGFHPKNVRKFQKGKLMITSPLLQAIDTFLKQTGEDLINAKAVIFGHSEIFIENLETLLKRLGIKSQHFHDINEQSTQATNEADVIVIALGQAECLKGEMIQKGAIIIDIGITKTEGQTLGDADKSVMDKAGYLTPVPGGVGPMTVAMLLENTYKLSQDSL